MIDIHTHILPGVDDGASDMRESLKIIEKGLKEGIKTFVLTPHIKDDSAWGKIDNIKEIFLALVKECKKNGLDVKLLLGAELLLVPDIVEKIKNNILVTIGGEGKYILLELPFSQLPIYTENILFGLLTKGIIPIISHIERYLYLRRDLDMIHRWIDQGIMTQINTGSLTGKYGWTIKQTAKKLLKEKLVHTMASDVHRFDASKSLFLDAVRIASKISPINEVEKITHWLPGVNEI